MRINPAALAVLAVSALSFMACPSGTDTDGGTGDAGGGSGGGSGGGGGGGGDDAGFISQLGAGYEGAGSAVRPCGAKLCVAGGVLREGSGTNADLLAARFELDATRDETFGDQGVAWVDYDGGFVSSLPFNLDNAWALEVDGDKLVAAGTARAALALSSGGFALARFNADGSLDSSFSGDGVVLLQLGNTSAHWFQVKRLSSGKYVVAGTIYNGIGPGDDYVVAVYNADGTPDTGFVQPGSTGFGHIAHLGFSDEQGVGLVVQASGKYVVGGGGFGVTRFLPTGAVDTSFADAGLYRGGEGKLDTVLERSDGRLWLLGFDAVPNPDGGSTEATMLKQQVLSADGALDSSFGAGGTRLIPLPLTQVRGAVVEPGDKALVYTGGFPGKLARLNADGTLDTSWGHGGTLDAGLTLPLLSEPVRGPANRLTLHAGRAFLTDFTVLQVSPSRTVQTFVLKEVTP
ncbi:MAG: hypothetical protein IT380_30055 [Myxococcales bacterium]|nr:hypothetical protein [Myxococcales bacterium]